MPALYRATLADFVDNDADSLVGVLATRSAAPGLGQLSHLQVLAWAAQIRVLQAELRLLRERLPRVGQWAILLEYSIPVIGRRPDAIILGDGHVFVIEYKAGNVGSAAAAFEQAQGYALDLLDFHEESRHRRVVPFALGLLRGTPRYQAEHGGVAAPGEFASRLLETLEALGGPTTDLDPAKWDGSRYFAVPTLVEAAANILDHHDVRELSHSRAGQDNLDATLHAILDAAQYAQRTNRKLLCIVTGVPGAGKTLAGLNAISHLVKTLDLNADQAAFLSGNSPLVKVLRKALALDLTRRRGRRVSVRSLESVIQQMHRFVQDTYESTKPPAHRAIVFDEAQRAWSKEKNWDKFKRNVSEPRMVLEIMGRHEGWSLVVGLVGGGQEIHSGEAGLSAWGDAVAGLAEWVVWASPEALAGGRSVTGSRLFGTGVQVEPERVVGRPELHLAIPKRSYEAENNARWVNAVLDGRVAEARKHAGERNRQMQFPVCLTRSLPDARRWLAARVALNRRSGLVASSGAARLRAEGVEPPTFNFLSGIDYASWFLLPKGRVSSSNQLEVAMSEFEMQGLELDHVGLLWGGDLIFPGGQPTTRRFRGEGWVEADAPCPRSDDDEPEGPDEEERGPISHRTLTLNKYRVLMTRYRKAMVIFVPLGDPHDGTRPPAEFDQVASYLLGCGVQRLETEKGAAGRDQSSA